jgi:c-di-GMP-binding flagellar brake protein YcgR
MSLRILPSVSDAIQGERREHRRYTVQVQIELHPEGGQAATRTETTDLSHGGCYVHLMTAMAVGVRVHATLWLAEETIVVHGRVVTRHPQFGNGIMFLDFEGRGEALLDRYLRAVVVD